MGNNNSELESCNRNRILVAEDYKSLQTLIAELLPIYVPECEVDVTNNGSEAIEAFQAEHHGIVVLDILMPVMDGEDAYKELLALCMRNKWEMPYVIFFTGQQPSKALRCLAKDDPKCEVVGKEMGTPFLLERIRHAAGDHAASSTGSTYEALNYLIAPPPDADAQNCANMNDLPA